MSFFIDTHAHIYLENFAEDIGEVLERSQAAGVERIYMPNIDSSTIADMLKLATDHPDTCIPMMGLHPCSVKENYREELAIVRNWFERREFAAVGEIGTDLYWDTTFKKEQVIAFQEQTRLALDKDLPIVIHCRESLDLTIDLVAEMQDGRLRGIFHCFTGSVEQAERIADLGFMMGIGGVATFKNGGMDKVLPLLSLDHLVLETDSPYLTPVPHRGKRNEPAYIPLIAERIAELKQISIEEVRRVSTNNAQCLFKYGL